MSTWLYAPVTIWVKYTTYEIIVESNNKTNLVVELKKYEATTN